MCQHLHAWIAVGIEEIDVVRVHAGVDDAADDTFSGIRLLQSDALVQVADARCCPGPLHVGTDIGGELKTLDGRNGGNLLHGMEGNGDADKVFALE